MFNFFLNPVIKIVLHFLFLANFKTFRIFFEVPEQLNAISKSFFSTKFSN